MSFKLFINDPETLKRLDPEERRVLAVSAAWGGEVRGCNNHELTQAAKGDTGTREALPLKVAIFRSRTPTHRGDQLLEQLLAGPLDKNGRSRGDKCRFAAALHRYDNRTIGSGARLGILHLLDCEIQSVEPGDVVGDQVVRITCLKWTYENTETLPETDEHKLKYQTITATVA